MARINRLTFATAYFLMACQLFQNSSAQQRCRHAADSHNVGRGILTLDSFPRHYSRCLAASDRNGTLTKFKVCIQGPSDEFPIASAVADLMNSRGNSPTPLNFWGEKLPILGIEYDNTEHCWDITTEEDFTYVFIKPREDQYIEGSFIGESLLPDSEVASSLEGGVYLTPARHLAGKVISCPCYPHRKILATSTALHFSDDGFLTNQRLQLPIGTTPTENITVSNALLTERDVFIILGSDAYVASVGSIIFSKVRISSGEDVEFIGGSASSICYKGASLPENSLVYLWSRKNVYRAVRKGPDTLLNPVGISQNRENIDVGSNILDLRPSVNPNFLYLLQRKSSPAKLSKCHVSESELGNCVEIPLFTFREAERVEPLSSARDSILVWNDSKLMHVTGSRNYTHTFPASIRNVVLNTAKNEWVVITKAGAVHFGLQYCSALFEVDLTIDSNSDIFFTHDGAVGIVDWESNAITRREDVNLHSSLTNVAPPSWETTNKLIRPSKDHSNVIMLDSLQDKSVVELSVLSTSDHGYRIDVYKDFQNLSITLDTKETVSTKRITQYMVVRSRTVTVEAISKCVGRPQSCQTGYGLIELAYVPIPELGLPPMPFGYSRLFLINMTCPAGLNLRVAVAGQRNCSGTEECYISLAEDEQLYLNFRVYRYDDFISDMTDNILLTELSNRTGFIFHNFNLLKKDCYQCSEFYEPSSETQLMLQTMWNACPCRSTVENADDWVGNISFEDSYSSSDRNIFRFSARAMGDSFCDLRNEFFIEIISDPSLKFRLWEYVFMIVCVCITAVSLFISYHNYIKHMKSHREKEKWIEATMSQSK